MCESTILYCLTADQPRPRFERGYRLKMAKGGTSTDIEIKINDNPELQSYYQSPESRIGYRLVLGGTRHFGYWDKETSCRSFQN